MAVLRKWGDFNCRNFNFLGVSLCLIVIYAIYLFEFIISERPSFAIPWLLITTLLHLMAVWSYASVTITDPGSVPQYWGIYTEELEKDKERKYCLICHNFKP